MHGQRAVSGRPEQPIGTASSSSSKRRVASCPSCSDGRATLSVRPRSSPLCDRVRVSSGASASGGDDTLPGCGASGYLSRSGRSVSRWTDRDGVSCGRTAFVPTVCDGLKNEPPLARRPGALFFVVSFNIRSLYGKRL